MKWSAKLIEHNGESRIAVYFELNKDLIQRIKKLHGVRWSRTLRVWHLPDVPAYRKQFKIEEKLIGKNAILKIDDVNKESYQKYLDLLYLLGYSKNTIRTYAIEFAQLLYVLKNKSIEDLNTEHLKSYLLYCIQVLEMSENQVHSRINAIKFYFEKVLNQPKIVMDMPRPRKPMLLPNVLHIEDISKMIKLTTNIKHKTILMLAYGMGLRVSEIVNLEIKHIDSKRMQVHIHGAKGKKDRYVNLPETVLPYLREYYIAYKPKIYLFEGQYGEKYSTRSAQQVFKQSLERARINKTIGIHGLRHSYATHLLEQGTDISYIQKLLGHNNIKTTLIYAHVGKKDVTAIKSPLDQIKW
jgi:site-specific recombinase XerD